MHSLIDSLKYIAFFFSLFDSYEFHATNNAIGSQYDVKMKVKW